MKAGWVIFGQSFSAQLTSQVVMRKIGGRTAITFIECLELFITIIKRDINKINKISTKKNQNFALKKNRLKKGGLNFNCVVTVAVIDFF